MSGNKAVSLTFLILFMLIFILLPATGVLAYDGACPPLAAPTGTTVTVSTEQEIYNEVNSATQGTTILIADGTYNLGQSGYYLWIDTPGITLRSESGNREAVILDDNYNGSEIITVAASNVTIAELTIMRAGTHPIHVVSTSNGDTLNTLIYNVHIIDPGQQAVKINPGTAGYFTDNGVVACSTIELTDAGRAKVLDINGSCYTGGVDAHQSQGWVVRDNIIKDFWCPNGLSEHGVHFWTGSRDTLVERNSFIDNARGIGFGLGESGSERVYSDDPCSGAIGHVGHFDGIIRNNFIFTGRAELYASEYGADSGISLNQACGARVLHNSVAFTSSPFSAIEWRFTNTDVDLINNLVTHNLMDRGGSADQSGNLSQQPLSLFVDGPNGDLHLDQSASVAIDQGIPVASGDCNDDYDGETRPIGSARDIGADEYNDGSGNTGPIANAQLLTVDEDSTANSFVLTGSDIDGNSLTFTLTGNPANGTLTGTAPNLLYTPDENYNGNDTFTFNVNDGFVNSPDAKVTITVNPVNDSPVANPQTITVVEDSTDNSIVLTGSDVDGDSLAYTVTSNPANGTLTGTESNLFYTPDTDYNGNDSFTFNVNDGFVDSPDATVNITIGDINEGSGGGGCFISIVAGTLR